MSFTPHGIIKGRGRPLAGVAQSTVSYVMSGNRPISQKTRDKVEKAMRELGYVPDAHARAMISNRSHIIGLLTETTETTQGAELFPSCGPSAPPRRNTATTSS